MRARATLCGLASALALFCGSAAQAGAIITPLNLAITTSILPLPPEIFPGDPFANSSFTGSFRFQTGHFFNDNQSFLADGSFGLTNIAGAPWTAANPQTFLLPLPPEIFPGEALVWQFGGNLSSQAGLFVTDAFVQGPPITPPPFAPLITLSADLEHGFAPFDVSGPIYGFDDPVQVGTWDVHISEVTRVPEPLTLSLFGTGLAGAVAMRRRKTKTA